MDEMSRLKAIILWLDQGLSAIILKSPDETFSAASFRLSLNGSRKWIFIRDAIDLLFWWDKDRTMGRVRRHCERSWEKEFMRHHLPNHYRACVYRSIEYKHRLSA